MGKEYEQIRSQVSKVYKDQIQELRKELEKTSKELDLRETEIRSLINENTKLKDENARLRKLFGKTDEEIDAMISASRGIESVGTMFGVLAKTPGAGYLLDTVNSIRQD